MVDGRFHRNVSRHFDGWISRKPAALLTIVSTKHDNVAGMQGSIAPCVRFEQDWA
jgi:hypothetical protein